PILGLDRPGPEHFLNGDLSLIEFNGRVLELAEDPSVPLLARIRFLSILSANLDEFFMVRVGTLKRAAASGGPVEEELHAIAIRVRALLERQARCFRDVCLPALAAHGVRILRWSDVSAAQQEVLRRSFTEEVFPLITPQAMTRAPGHPFPLIPYLRLSLPIVAAGAAGRVEIAGGRPESVQELLLRELQFEEAAAGSPLGAGDLYAAEGLLDLGAVRELARLPLPELDHPPHRGGAPIEAGRSIFAILAERDILVHHPYDAFEATVQRLVTEAADEPDVVALKLTLYRAGGRSEIVAALLRAAGRGKEVFVF